MNKNKINKDCKNYTHGEVDNNSPEFIEKKETKQNKNKVLIYLCALFITAFLLMLLSYLINQRNNNAAMSDLTETHRTVTESAFENIEKLQDDNRLLNDELEASKTLIRELESDLSDVKSELETTNNRILELQEDADNAEKRLIALEKLVELESLIRQNDFEAANTIVQEIEEDSLAAYLPDVCSEEYLKLVAMIQN